MMDEQTRGEMLETLRKLDATNGDPEVAHDYEDRLLWEVAELVLSGDWLGAQLLAEALRNNAREHKGTRWYA